MSPDVLDPDRGDPAGLTRCLAPGERLERPSCGSEPHVLPVRRAWCGVWRARRGSNPPHPARQAGVPARGPRARRNSAGAAGRICTSTALRPRGYSPLGSLMPKPTRDQHGIEGRDLTSPGHCHAYSVFKVLAPATPGQKERARRLPGPEIHFSCCLVVGVCVTPPEKAQDPATLDLVTRMPLRPSGQCRPE